MPAIINYTNSSGRIPGFFATGACRGTDPSLFVGHRESYETPSDYDLRLTAAKRICAGCSHEIDCREFGFLVEDGMIYGGLDAKERRAIKRRQKAAG